MAEGCNKINGAVERGPPGRKCGRHCHTCEVKGCTTAGRTMKLEKDRFGPPGWRCTRHGRSCNVRGCNNAGKCKNGSR